MQLIQWWIVESCCEETHPLVGKQRRKQTINRGSIGCCGRPSEVYPTQPEGQGVFSKLTSKLRLGGWVEVSLVFPVVMYRCESWTIKKAEHQIIDAFELWCWRRLLRVPWISRRSNQSILKEISPEYSLEGLMSKLKLQYFGHLMWRTY